MISWPVNFKSLKYSKWYDALIYKAQCRGKLNGYKEIHHIVPRSFGGNNEKSNLVQLTAREHYIAHALLWKMKFEGVYGSKMAFAFNTFISKMRTTKAIKNIKYRINSRIYESFRKEYSQILKEKYAREGGTFLGRTHSEETKRKIGEKSRLKDFKRGSEHPSYGKKLNLKPEAKSKKLDAVKKMWDDPIKRQQVLESRKIANQRPEVIAKRKDAANMKKGVKRDPKIIEKMAVTKRGKTWEELYTPEQIERMKTAIKNRVLSEESKSRMSFKGKGKGIPKVKKSCQYCGKVCAGNMLAKWHGSNCKLAKTGIDNNK